MMDTREIVEAWEREKEAVGRAQGLAQAAEALAKGLVVIYEIHSGTMPPELKAVVDATKEGATLLAWLQLVETSSAEVFAATVLASRAG